MNFSSAIIKQFLFSFEGRINRFAYWCYTFAVIIYSPSFDEVQENPNTQEVSTPYHFE